MVRRSIDGPSWGRRLKSRFLDKLSLIALLLFKDNIFINRVYNFGVGSFIIFHTFVLGDLTFATWQLIQVFGIDSQVNFVVSSIIFGFSSNLSK